MTRFELIAMAVITFVLLGQGGAVTGFCWSAIIAPANGRRNLLYTLIGAACGVAVAAVIITNSPRWNQ